MHCPYGIDSRVQACVVKGCLIGVEVRDVLALGKELDRMAQGLM